MFSACPTDLMVNLLEVKQHRSWSFKEPLPGVWEPVNDKQIFREIFLSFFYTTKCARVKKRMNRMAYTQNNGNHQEHLAIVAPSMHRWSADQDTFMIWTGRRSPELVYLVAKNDEQQKAKSSRTCLSYLGTVIILPNAPMATWKVILIPIIILIADQFCFTWGGSITGFA